MFFNLIAIESSLELFESRDCFEICKALLIKISFVLRGKVVLKKENYQIYVIQRTASSEGFPPAPWKFAFLKTSFELLLMCSIP